MNVTKRSWAGAVVVIAIVSLAGVMQDAHAAVTDAALYHLGETGSLGTNNRPQDSAGGHHYASNSGTGTSTTSDAAYGSTAALRIPNPFGFYNTGSWTVPTNNFGVETWVRTSNTTQSQNVLYTNANNNGSLKIGQSGANWAASYHNAAWIGPTGGVTNSVKANTWMHLAVVRDGGTSTLYINGAPQTGTPGNTPVHNSSQFHLSVAPGGASSWAGDLDEMRIFTFTAGNFSTNDLLFHQQTGDFVNPSFEDDVAGFMPHGWQVSGNLNVADGQTASDGVNAIAFNGGDSTPNGVLLQTFDTTPGHLYELTFDFGKYATGTGTAQLDVDGFDTTVGDSILLLDQTVSDASGATSGVYDPYAFQFTATGANTSLRFTDTSIGTASFDAMLDNITVTPVPEPSSLALAVLSLLGLMGTRRRCRS